MGDIRDETDFNRELREVLRNHGYSVIHVRETADTVGVLDLLVYEGRQIKCWIELKIDKDQFRPSQREFIRDQEALGIPCLLIRFWPVSVTECLDERLIVCRPATNHSEWEIYEKWRLQNWGAILDSFDKST